MTTSHRSSQFDQLLADIEALTRPFHHTEQLDGNHKHHTKHQSLLNQLEQELEDSAKPSFDLSTSSGSKTPAESKPPVNEELLALVLKAAALANRIVKGLGGKLRSTPSENFAQIPSLLSASDDETVDTVVSRISRLRSEIEIKLSWKQKPRRLAAKCPLCDQPGGVIVHMDGHGPIGAKCRKCDAEWDRGVLGVLAGGLDNE